MFTMLYEFGDVVLVRFPFTNQAAFKQRPAVVVSRREYNVARPDVVLMPITSQFRSPTSLGEVLLMHWQAAGLLKPSAIKPVFATIEHALVIKGLGKLQQNDQDAVVGAIGEVLGT